MTLTGSEAAEIAAARAQTSPTLRLAVPALEAMLYQAFPVLDHGFVRVIDCMGDDSAIVQAARVSYGRGTRRVSENAGLIRYLMRHRHSTPSCGGDSLRAFQVQRLFQTIVSGICLQSVFQDHAVPFGRR